MSIPHRLVVIGAGPGGYAAAFYAADRGMQVTLVDPEPNPGGVCLYRGCIPSKALLHVAERHQRGEARRRPGASTFGAPTIDLDKLRAFKDKVVTQLTGGLGPARASCARSTTSRARRRSATRTRSTSTQADGTTSTLDVRARDHRHRLAADDRARAVDRQPARDGLDRRARPARRPEVAARRRRRLHRPRARQRLRRARQRRSPSSR